MKIGHLTGNDWAHVDPTPLQRLARVLLTRPGRALYRYRGYGHSPRVPREGGFLLAPGPHGAFLDPVIYGLGQARHRLRFMAKYQALEWFLVGRVIRWGGGFPVTKGRSSEALAVARHVVDSGDGLVMFMEGRMVLEHPGLGEPRSGLARMALATGAPVVPVAAYGAKRASAYGKRWWWHWPRVTVVWGDCVTFPREDDPTEERVAQVRDEIWARVGECFERARVIGELPGRRPRDGTPLSLVPGADPLPEHDDAAVGAVP